VAWGDVVSEAIPILVNHGMPATWVMADGSDGHLTVCDGMSYLELAISLCDALGNPCSAVLFPLIGMC